jgi:hypothetical protein
VEAAGASGISRARQRGHTQEQNKAAGETEEQLPHE